MTNYNNGKIYKIVCNITGMVYIGSTCENYLSRRLQKHKGDFNSFLKNIKKRIQSSCHILENNDYRIELIELFPCSCKDELRAREQFFIDSVDCINKNNAMRDPNYQKQYYDKHKKQLLEKQKQYNEDKKEMIAVYKKEYSEKNKEKLADKYKEYRVKNKEQLSNYTKEYREANKEQIKEKQREYRENNKEKLALKKKEYYQSHKEEISLRRKEKYASKNLSNE